MRTVALKGLWQRRGRTLLTTLAVVLGVAMVCGTFVLTDTISKAFDGIFRTSAASTSAVVTGKPVAPGLEGSARPLPASVLARVRAADGVAAASGSVEATGDGNDQVRIVASDGKTVGTTGPPKLGFGIDPGARAFNPFSLVRGHFARGPGEVAIDRGTASRAGIGVGDTVGLAARGRTERFRVVGVVRFGEVASIGGATMAVLDVGTAQRLLGRGDRYDQISVAAAPGVADATLAASLQRVTGAGTVVRTGAQQADANAADVTEATGFMQTFLLVFAFIALGVGAFVIANTLSITVTQRTRELATLRALGASRRQVRRSVLLEGLATGVLASALGLAAGYGLAVGLRALMGALGLELPSVDPVVEPRTILVSVAVGVVVTTLASVLPARRATRVPPVVAMRDAGPAAPATQADTARGGTALDGAARRGTARGGRTSAAAGRTLGTRETAATGAFGLAVVGVLLGSLGGLGTGGGLVAIGVGVVALFVGVALVAARLVGPLAALVGGPARRFGGVPGALASENAVRDPARTARTAAALMIGLALVTVVATLGQGFRSSDRDYLESTVSAPVVVASTGGDTALPPAVGAAVAKLPGASVEPVRSDDAAVDGEAVRVNGVSRDAAGMLDVGARLPGRGEAVVADDWASEHGVRAGDTLPLTAPTGRRVEVRVAAIKRTTPIEDLAAVTGPIVLDRATFDTAFRGADDAFVLVRGVTTAQVANVTDAFADVTPRTRAGWIDQQVGFLDMLLNLLYVLLALSVVVSLFGMVNTQVLSVFERTREIGMLRAIGTSRRQVRAMVRHESIVVALIGAALGLPLGLGLAGVLSLALADEGLSFAVPFGMLATFALVAVLAGVLAAIAPARRAARLDVLRALHAD